MTFSSETRRNHLMSMISTPLDLLIIGGGLTGSSIALDAISRGLGVAVVDMGDFSSGSSKNATPILTSVSFYHDPWEIKNRANVGRERALSYENAPHISLPITMMLPFYQRNPYNKITTPLKLKSYDLLAGMTKEAQHFTLKRKDTLKREPLLKADKLSGSGFYRDYRRDDSRLTIETLKKATEFGAYTANYTKVEKLLYDRQSAKIIGARIKDLITGQEYPVYAKRVINAAGSWADTIRELDHSKQPKDTFLTKSTHLLINSEALPLTNSLVFTSPFNEHQTIVALPREGRVYVGTHWPKGGTTIKKEAVNSFEMTYLLAALNDVLNANDLTEEAVEVAWNESHLQQKDFNPLLNNPLILADSGLYSIIKAGDVADRLVAEKVVNTVLRDICGEYDRLFIKCRTKNLRLSGGDVGGSEGFKRYIKEFLKIGIEKFHLSYRDSNLLARRYGANVIDLFAYLLNVPESSNLADIDYIQLRYALEEEMTLHPVDFLLRRTGYMVYNMAHCRKIKDDVIQEMAKYYQWSPAYVEKMSVETDQAITRHLPHTN